MSSREKIRVLQICDKFGVKGSSVHGVSRLFSWWIPAMADVFETVVCGLKEPDRAGVLLEEKGISLVYLGRGKYDPRILSGLYGLVGRLDPHLLHLHGYGACTYGRLLGRFTGRPTILHEHYVDHRMSSARSLLERGLSPLTDWALVGCQAVKRALIEKRWIPEERIRVIYPGIPLRDFDPARYRDGEPLRRTLGIRPEEKVVGTVARLHEQKGHRFFIEAIPGILAVHPETRFLIVGDGHLRSELERQVSRAGLQEHVVFTGHREDVPAIISLMDVKVIASLYEATTLTVFEAMALGKPIVATNVDGLREVVLEGVNGLLVPPRDPTALADRVNLLLSDAELHGRISAGARRESRKYDNSEFVRRLETYYREILDARLPGRGGRSRSWPVER